MSKQVIKNYSFSVSAKTITLTDFSSGQPVRLDRLALITDTTTNQVLYNFADSTIATAAVSSNNVITLSALPSGVANGDSLRIDYDIVSGDPSYDTTGQTKLSDGTNIANVLAGNTGQNGLVTIPARSESTFSINAAGNTPTIDVSNYSWLSVQVTATSSGVGGTFQISNDGITFYSLPLMNASSTTSATTITTGTFTTGLWHGPISGRYFRVSVTGSVTTFAGTVELFAAPHALQSLGATVVQTGTWNVGSSSATGSAVPSTAHYLGITSTGSVLAGLNSGINMGDANSAGTWAAIAPGIYNGTNFDRQRTATSAAGTTGTGLIGAGILGFDGTNYQRIKTDTSGNLSVSSLQSDGTNVGNILKSDGTAAGQNAQLVAGTYLEKAGLSTASTTNNDLLTSIDVSNYKWASLQLTGTWTGTITVQISNDNVNFNAQTVLSSSATGVQGSVTAAGLYSFPITARYLRIRVTIGGTGTVTGVAELYTTTAPSQSSAGVTAGQTGTWSVGANSPTASAAPTNAFYQGAVASTSLPTAATAGNLTGELADKFGRQVVIPHAMRDLVLPITRLTITSSSAETTLITAVASTFLDLASLTIVNTSAVATQVDFRDSTGGTIRWTAFVPATDMRGIVFNVPLPQSAVNNNWTAQCASSGSSIIITGSYITNK